MLFLLALRLRIVRPPCDRTVAQDVSLHERCVWRNSLIPRVRHRSVFVRPFRNPNEGFPFGQAALWKGELHFKQALAFWASSHEDTECKRLCLWVQNTCLQRHVSIGSASLSWLYGIIPKSIFESVNYRRGDWLRDTHRPVRCACIRK